MLFRLAVLVFATATVISEEEEGSQENGIALLFDSVGAAESCDDLYDRGNRQDGDYELQVNGTWVSVYCQFGDPAQNQHHYIVFQRRIANGSVNFYQNWANYTDGFGNYTHEFWLGLKTIHKLTGTNSYQLIIKAEDFANNSYTGLYTTFKVDSEAAKYNLTISGYNGTDETDSLKYNNGHVFSARDKDNDEWSGNCASARRCGWWFDRCTFANPNGLHMGDVSGDAKAMYLFKWKQLHALKSTEIKMRRTPPDDITDEITSIEQ